MKVYKTVTLDKNVVSYANYVRAKLLERGIDISFSELVESALRYLFGEEDAVAKRVKEVSSPNRPLDVRA